mmetsp:Transcript_17108/g.31015  ORF Transcript_17108/g.31015 Transcript_17108/m.31015 type:complete len:100 (-) Transcript_17108:94-393(-)
MTIAVRDWYWLSITRGDIGCAPLAGMAVCPALERLVADFRTALGGNFCGGLRFFHPRLTAFSRVFCFGHGDSALDRLSIFCCGPSRARDRNAVAVGGEW